MIYKIIRIIGLVAAVVTILASGLSLVKGIRIPGLAPFSLSVVMLSLIYTNKQQYIEGKLTKDRWRFMLIICLSAAVLNIAAGISQIVAYRG